MAHATNIWPCNLTARGVAQSPVTLDCRGVAQLSLLLLCQRCFCHVGALERGGCRLPAQEPKAGIAAALVSACCCCCLSLGLPALPRQWVSFSACRCSWRCYCAVCPWRFRFCSGRLEAWQQNMRFLNRSLCCLFAVEWQKWDVWPVIFMSSPQITMLKHLVSQFISLFGLDTLTLMQDLLWPAVESLPLWHMLWRQEVLSVLFACVLTASFWWQLHAHAWIAYSLVIQRHWDIHWDMSFSFSGPRKYRISGPLSVSFVEIAQKSLPYLRSLCLFHLFASTWLAGWRHCDRHLSEWISCFAQCLQIKGERIPTVPT